MDVNQSHVAIPRSVGALADSRQGVSAGCGLSAAERLSARAPTEREGARAVFRQVFLAGAVAASFFAATCSSAGVRIGTFLTQVKGVAEQEKIPLEEAAARAKSLGIEGFDANFSERAEIAVLVKAGLKPVSLYGFFHMEKKDESARLARYLATAEEFGFRRLMVVPGDYLRGGILDLDAERKEAIASIVAQLKPFVAQAKAKGLVVTVEDFDSIPSPCSLVYGLDQIFAAIPDLQLTFDTGNFTYVHDDLLKAFDHFRGRIRHVHLKDRLYAPVTHDRIWGECCAIGKGVKPIAEIVRRLVEEGYDGWLIEEHYSSPRQWSDMQESMAYLNVLLKENRPSDQALAKRVAADVVRPVRPALVNGQPFWNEKARLFMYPPSFAFTNVAGAAKYRYRLLDDQLEDHAFESSVPTATLDPVWGALPSGWTKLRVEALDAKGTVLGLAGERKFWKSAAYRPNGYPKPKATHRECVRTYFDWLYAMKNTELIRETGAGDPDYVHNCYPAKMYSALARAMVCYVKLRPEKKDEILLTAKRCCDYLISVSQPDGAPLAHFAPTYSGRRMTAGQYAGMNMLLYPADAANAYLAVFAATGGKTYLAAAERVAETYMKLQGADGTWFLKLWEKDGTSVCPNRLFPIRVVELMEELFRLTGKDAYRACADRAFAFVEKGPLSDWNWEGQFEDVKPSAPYQNLTKHPACETALYLLKRFPGDARRLAQARELLRFSEDQFVCWEKPVRGDYTSGPIDIDSWSTGVRNWAVVPAALEQYGWYVPIDASNAKLIRTYLALYRAEKDPLDLEKARTLGDSIVRAQEQLGTGSIPTQWVGWDMLPTSEPWINCGIAAALSLIELEETK